MTRTSREDWIEEGFRILEEEGDAALTVEALCERIGRTKGSFYHHFRGRDGYVDALLEAWERRSTDQLIESVEAEGSVEERLRRLNHRASEEGSPRLERAVRAWAAREPRARETQERVDRRRLDFLEDLMEERMGQGESARRLARVFQLVFVGAQHLDPPFEGAELYRTFRFLDPLLERGGRV
ncbi:MAG: TetR/AcrR family transcriptional regulator [Gemmatimonadetes bacterium]|nr:TetR/AcrR family transcriptional regulator [Gemmatimonadota bacterium]